MEKIHFSVGIDASKEKVWSILWGKDSYSKWTAPFCEGSRAETDWEKGSKVHFLGPSNEGMVSIIEEKIPNTFMSFRHMGVVKNGVEDYNSEESKVWSGSHENYTIKTVDGKTELCLDMDMVASHKDFFMTAWPKALEKVKELAEEK